MPCEMFPFVTGQGMILFSLQRNGVLYAGIERWTDSSKFPDGLTCIEYLNIILQEVRGGEEPA